MRGGDKRAHLPAQSTRDVATWRVPLQKDSPRLMRERGERADMNGPGCRPLLNNG